jgi:hypothetical protein
MDNGRLICARDRSEASSNKFNCWLECDFGYVAEGSNIVSCDDINSLYEGVIACNKAELVMVIAGESKLFIAVDTLKSLKNYFLHFACTIDILDTQ